MELPEESSDFSIPMSCMLSQRSSEWSEVDQRTVVVSDVWLLAGQRSDRVISAESLEVKQRLSAEERKF